MKPDFCRASQAGGEGFEPPYTDSESAVLPLDEPPILNWALFYQKEPKVSSGSFEMSFKDEK